MSVSGQDQVEKLVGQLKDVISVTVRHSGEHIDRVHVLTTSGRPEDQLARDVRSAIIARLNLPITPDKIRVTVLPGDSLRAIQPGRPALTSVQVVETDGLLEARVTLTHNGQLIEGRRAGSPESKATELGAEATLDAIHQVLGQKAVFRIEHIQKGRIAGRELVLAAVQLRAGRLVRQLLGSAYVDGSEYQATAQAVLDAVNRQFERQVGVSSK